MSKNKPDEKQLTNRAFIALGANLGERTGTLLRALDCLRLRNDVRVIAVSSFHDTAPEGGAPDQPRYLNAAAEMHTALGPRELLNLLLRIEKALGRDRSKPERNAPRIIDLDLLLYADCIVKEDGLEVPHPRMHERLFVLKPLCEIAARQLHPVLRLSMAQLADALSARSSSGIL